MKAVTPTQDFVRDYTKEKLAKRIIKECYYNGLVSDISNVNFNKRHVDKNISLIPLTPMFCDNIMLTTNL